MASTASTSSGGIPLDEYWRDVPPGWCPGSLDYPLKLYMERVKMWYRIYEGLDESVGPSLAGRLRGRAQQIALTLRWPDPHGGVDIGDSALIRLSVDEVRDPTTGQIIQQAIPSGVQALLAALRAAFGEADQLRATRAMEVFFEFKRGRMALPEWSVQWQLNLDEAITHSGLDLNNVARTSLYLKSSQLGQKTIDDLLLQVHGAMARFGEIRTLMLRMAHRSFETNSNAAMYEESSHHYGDGESYDNYYQQWPEYEYGCDEEQLEENNEKADDEPTQPEMDETYYKGKGRSMMGLGCGTCGSKRHNTHSCPMNDAQKGKSKKKSYGKGKSKGFGKYKGKGKGFGSKGFGKSKNYAILVARAI
eukprot:s1483_g21.t1